MIIGIDAGNYEVKAISPTGSDKFPSEIGEYRDRRLEQTFSADDMIVEHQGKKFFAGTLARYESEFAGSMMGGTKAHNDTLLRVLLALARQDSDKFKVIVGQPIGGHVEGEKDRIKAILSGWHAIKVNGKTRRFYCERIEVAAEGGAAFWAAPRDGLTRIIDIGSATINCATLIDGGKYVDRDSFTLPFGMNTTKSRDLAAMARAISVEALKKWAHNDPIFVAGGAAKAVTPFLQQHLPCAEILRPHLKLNGQYRQLDPVFANAVGFYRIGEVVYD